MLAILTTHPIQYQVPLWQMLAKDGRIPFEVWYLTDHAARQSRDEQFGTSFAWDLDMLKGYPHRFLKTPDGANPNTFWRARVSESLPMLFEKSGASVLWVQGWQVAAYWQAVWAARASGRQVWLRGESNAMAPIPWWKERVKRPLLGAFFRRVDQFLCIGSANRELYRHYKVPEEKLHMALYAVDNERFAAQAEAAKSQRAEIRRQWGIPDDAYAVLFCGKFISKKRPLDLIQAVQLLLVSHPELKLHLLFVGSGELGAELRAACNVAFDADSPARSEVRHGESVRWRIGGQRSGNREPITNNQNPPASFAGFLNQTEISRAYVAADLLVLPSDYGETWGLVVNETMASGLRCVISNRCGCAPDLGDINGNAVFQCANLEKLADAIASVAVESGVQSVPLPSLDSLAASVIDLYTGEKHL